MKGEKNNTRERIWYKKMCNPLVFINIFIFILEENRNNPWTQHK